MTITTERKRPTRSESYAPEIIGSWVATKNREMPWVTIGHALEGSSGDGTTVDHLMTAAEALEISGLGITVRKVQVNDAETGKPIPNQFHTFYEDGDDRVYFGPVSDIYEVVQPAAALAWFDDVIAAADGSHYQAVWSMLEKSQMGVAIEFPQTIVVDPGGADDTMGLYGIGIDSFDGSTSLQLAASAMRWGCMNQLPPTFKGAPRAYCTKHTANVSRRIADARAAVGITMNWAREFDVIANKLFQAKCSENQLIRLANTFPEFRLDGSESDLRKARMEDRRAELIMAWNAPHNATIVGTKWGAFNVIAEWADWGRNVQGSRRNGTDPVRQRAIGTLVNFPQSMKSKCLQRLMA